MSELHREISELADLKLRDWLKNGRPAVGPDGQPVLDESGNQTYRELSATEMQCVLRRLEKLGITALPVQGSAAGALRDEAERRNFKFTGFGKLDTESDDIATTG